MHHRYKAHYTNRHNKRFIPVLLSVFLLSVSIVMSFFLLGCNESTHTVTGKFLGIEGFKNLSSSEDLKDESKQVYMFNVDNQQVKYSMLCDADYTLQNKLKVNYDYDLYLNDNNQVVDLVQLVEDETVETIAKGDLGKRTLKNFITTACMPLGKTLFIMGGGWNFQDTGGNKCSKTIGVPKDWATFYNQQDANFDAVDSNDYKSPYYSTNNINLYSNLGVDISGYFGWIFYNTFYSEQTRNFDYVKLKPSYPVFLETMLNYGTYDAGNNAERVDIVRYNSSNLVPGDILRLVASCQIYLGSCSDGSMVFLSASLQKSSTGHNGGGVNLSCVNPEGDSNKCEAYNLVTRFYNKFFPEWLERYSVQARDYETFSNIIPNMSGVFHWYLNGNGGSLSDPDDYVNKSAEEILTDIFGSF